MNITEAKRIAKRLLNARYYGIDIVLSYPDLNYRVTAINRAGMRRDVSDMEECNYLLNTESR